MTVEDTAAAVDDVPTEAGSQNCRWCGAPHEGMPGEDWLCEDCDHYQGSMICPTCGGLASVAALPADVVPAPVMPASPKKGKK